MFLVFGMCFGLLEGFLDSRIEVFWILGVFLNFGTCFGFWDVFWTLGRVLDSGKCFLILGRVLTPQATVCLWLVEENIFRGMICQKYYLALGSDKTSVWNSCARSS